MSAITTEKAPESCPFCGAAQKPACGFAWFTCGTSTRRDQTSACAHAERERLTRERDEAKKAAETAMVELGQVASSRRDLLSRVKHLEADWAGWTDLQREWFGDKYAAMQPWDAVRARIEDSEARIKRLEEESESRWLLAQSAIGSCAEMSSRIKQLEEAGDFMAYNENVDFDELVAAWTKAKEATR